MAVPVRIRRLLPTGGLYTAAPGDGIEPTKSPGALNVRFRFGEVRPAPGRLTLAAAVAATDSLWIGRFPLTDGSEWALMLTETGAWRWGNGAPGTPRAWSIITGGALGGGTARWATAVGEDKFFWARTGEAIRRWPKAGGTVPTADWEAIPASAGTVPKARYLEYFNNRLIAGWTTEGGTDFSNRIRWSANGVHTDWDSAAATGAGFLDLYEGDQEPLYGVKALGPRCALYRANSITDLIPTGTVTPTFVTEVRVRGKGTKAPWTIAGNGQVHFFLGTDSNVYAWDGSRVVPIGDPILEDLRGLTSQSRMGMYFGVVVTARQEYWLILDGGIVFVYDFARDAWSRELFTDLTALGEVVDTMTAETWDSVTTTWDTETRTWDEMLGVSSLVLWAGTSASATMSISDTVTANLTGDMDRYVETPDYSLPSAMSNGESDPMQMATLTRLLVTYGYTNTAPFEVGVSLDHGRTWNTKVVTPSVGGYSVVSWNLTGNCFRTRLRQNDALAQCRWRSVSYEFLPMGPFNG